MSRRRFSVLLAITRKDIYEHIIGVYDNIGLGDILDLADLIQEILECCGVEVIQEEKRDEQNKLG